MSIANWIGILIMIIVVLYFLKTETGSYYLDLVKTALGSLVPKIFKSEAAGNTTVEVFMESKNSLQSFNIEVKETELRITTEAENMKNLNIKIAEIKKLKNGTIEINMSIKKGFLLWKDDGSLKFIGSIYKMSLDDLSFPSDIGFEVNIEAYPKKFSIDEIKAKELVFLNSFGNLSTEKGILKLKGDELRLRSFSGSLSLNNFIKIKGVVSKMLINNKPADILS